jgi:hypothetical protein
MPWQVLRLGSAHFQMHCSVLTLAFGAVVIQPEHVTCGNNHLCGSAWRFSGKRFGTRRVQTHDPPPPAKATQKYSIRSTLNLDRINYIVTWLCVTVDGVRIGNRIYWTLIQLVTTINYDSLTELHTPKIVVTAAYINSSQSSLAFAW